MKPAPFRYVRPRTVAEALSVLSSDPDDSKVLAGGQSLVPMMNLRLARPGRIVDINALPGLDRVTESADSVVVGPLTRHLAVQNTHLSGPLGVLLRRTARHIGHLPIRTRGTFGGSIAHSDAASEWCLLARLLDARITVVSERGRRTVAAEDFFVSVFTTAMAADEILVEVELPRLPATHRVGVAEFARRAGDFAVVAAMSDVAVADEVVTAARVCLGGVSDTPYRSGAAERMLVGERWSADLMLAAADAAAAEVDPPSDAHGDADYRRALVRALLPRALAGGSEDR